MKRITSLIAATALALCATAAIAACPEKDQSNTAGISKDGTHAPLEGPKQDAAEAPAKDGNTMPLANQEGGGNKNLATSEQDVEAQQKGDKTAAAKAAEECKD